MLPGRRVTGRQMNRRLFVLFLAAAALAPIRMVPAASRAVLGYTAEVPTESAEARAERHRRVAERRSEHALVIVHRGASAFAPENTLEAYAAAMDYGADGCEVDVRRTADGVLVLFHDDMLDHLTEGFGTVPQVTYYQLLSLRPRFRYGTTTASTRPPTFAALLALARQRAMLLHLDVKENGLDTQIADLLTQADAWDQIVGVNTATAPVLAKDPRVSPIAYKGPGLFEGRRDLDPESVRAQLVRPGKGVMVDDPRLAALQLKRPPYRPVSIPPDLRAKWEPRFTAKSAKPDTFVPMDYLTRLEKTANTPAELRKVLEDASSEAQTEPDGTPEYQRQRTERIVARAWAAQQMGERGVRNRETVALLERQITMRSLHRDWMYHGLDGALAARALARLHAMEAVPTLVQAFRRIDPALTKVQDPRYGPYPLAWTDFRVKMYVLPALGDLPCKESKALLMEYLSLPEAAAREWGPLQHEEATRALLRQDLTEAELETLLRSNNLAIRGPAILECLDHPTRRRTSALQAAAPWALELPRAVH